jgi:hypothetical protein
MIKITDQIDARLNVSDTNAPRISENPASFLVTEPLIEVNLDLGRVCDSSPVLKLRSWFRPDFFIYEIMKTYIEVTRKVRVWHSPVGINNFASALT